MEDYLARFALMVEGLRDCPDEVALLGYNVFEPVAEETVAEVEKSLGFALAESVKSFFRQTNGLQLRWMSKASPEYDPRKHRLTYEPFDGRYPWSGYLTETGLVNILPLEEIFFGDWRDYVWFENEGARQTTFFGVEYNSLFFKQHVKPFDLFNKYYTMAFFVGDGRPDPKVLMGSDHNADFTSTEVTDFESYVEFLIAKKGAVEERAKLYGAEWDSAAEPKPLLITRRDFWTDEKILKLCGR
jgi:hypothetical protein